MNRVPTSVVMLLATLAVIGVPRAEAQSITATIEAARVCGNNTDPLLLKYLAVDETLNRAYSLGWTEDIGDTVTVIDLATNAVVATVPLPPPSCGNGYLAVNSQTHQVYVHRGHPVTIDIIDGTSLSVSTIATHPFHKSSYAYGDVAHGIAVDETRNKLYIVGYFNEAGPAHSLILELDGATNQFTNVIPIPQSMEGAVPYSEARSAIEVNPHTGRVYLPAYYNFVVVDPATGSSTLIEGPSVTDSATGEMRRLTLDYLAIHPTSGALHFTVSDLNVGGGDRRYFATYLEESAEWKLVPMPYSGDGDGQLTFFQGGYSSGLVLTDTYAYLLGWEWLDEDGNPRKCIYVIDPETGRIVTKIYDVGTTHGVVANRTTGQVLLLDSSSSPDIFLVVISEPTTTRVGSNISVSPNAALADGSTVNVTVGFVEVDTAGMTTVTVTDSPTEGVQGAPPGFKTGNPEVYFDVTTTATFSGTVTLCFGWSDGQFQNPDAIRLWHYDSDAWVDVTTLVDVAGRSVCGQVSHFSPFALFETAYSFGGFLSPVAKPPARNAVRAGAAVPLRFSLGGDFGLGVFSVGFPASQPTHCDTGVTTATIEETVTAGGSSLSYDVSTGLYTYVWKTDKSWVGSCRTLVVRFNDGSVYTADFVFTK